jgi:hypothetical protein
MKYIPKTGKKFVFGMCFRDGMRVFAMLRITDYT